MEGTTKALILTIVIGLILLPIRVLGDLLKTV